jgi:hypothetical protein
MLRYVCWRLKKENEFFCVVACVESGQNGQSSDCCGIKPQKLQLDKIDYMVLKL